MLHYAIIFFLLSFVSACVGYADMGESVGSIARSACYLLMGLAFLNVAWSLAREGKPRSPMTTVQGKAPARPVNP